MTSRGLPGRCPPPSGRRLASCPPVTDYLSAMQQIISAITDPEAAFAATEWHLWSEEWVTPADPLARPLAMPVVPEPRPDDLKPFLGGWNYHGPGARHGDRLHPGWAGTRGLGQHLTRRQFVP